MNVTAYLLVGHYIFGLFCIPVICLSIMNVKPFDHRPKSTIASAVVMVSAQSPVLSLPIPYIRRKT